MRLNYIFFLVFIFNALTNLLSAQEFLFIQNSEECGIETKTLRTSPAILALEKFNMSLDIPLRLTILCKASTIPWKAEKFALMNKLGFWVQGPEDFQGDADLFYIRNDVLSRGSYDYWLNKLWPHENVHKIQASTNPNLAQMMWINPGKEQSVYGAFMEAYADYGFDSTPFYQAQKRMGILLDILEDRSLVKEAGEGNVSAYENLRDLYNSKVMTIIDAKVKNPPPLFDDLFLPHP